MTTVSTLPEVNNSFTDPRRSLPPHKFCRNAVTILEKRYLRKNEQGEYTETIEDLFARVAWHLSEPEGKNRERFARQLYDDMIDGIYMPNTPTLFNAGTGNGMSLSACFVRVPQDSLDSIMQVNTDLALIQKGGGGVGYNFSALRPRGSLVKSCGATTDGPLPFIDMYCATTGAIQQGAKRRGAQMGILRIDHPDIWYFIQAKANLRRWQNMNVSIQVPDWWMTLVKAHRNTPHLVHHDKWGTGRLQRNLATGEVTPLQDNKNGAPGFREVTVGEVFDEICGRAWRTGEPGLAFWDRIERDWTFKNHPEKPYRLESTNPCGEVPLEDGGSCTLGSLNLSKIPLAGPLMASDPQWWASVEETLGDWVSRAVRYLDNVVTMNKFPVEKISEVNKNTRRIGLGVMGFADLLFKLEVPYDSDEARQVGKKLAETIHRLAKAHSKKLGDERGYFPLAERSLPPEERRRNAYLTMVAPTGTISIIANCLVGDTLIHTINGKKKIRDIVGTEQLVYTSGKSEILVRRAHNIRLTRQRAEVWKVKFDTGDELIATPEHQLMLSSGSWKQLKDLLLGDSLRCFYKSLWTPEKDKEGLASFSLYMTNLPRKMDHRAIVEYKVKRKLGKSEHVHHIDGNRLNNNISNLEVLTATEHARLHDSLAEWNKSCRGKTLEETHGKELANKIKTTRSRTMLGKKNHRYGYKLSVEEKKVVSRRTKEAMARPEIRSRFLEGIKSRNHKVVSVEFHGYKDVYNMEVEETENFVANDVVVHNCSAGIEPLYSLAFKREVLRNDIGEHVTMTEVNAIFEHALENLCSRFAKAIIAQNGMVNLGSVAQFKSQIVDHVMSNGTLRGYTNTPVGCEKDWTHFCKVFQTSKDISMEGHVLMQAAWQSAFDQAISKTVNLGHDSTVEDVKKAYMLAWETECKGITVYRDGSRDNVEGMKQPMKLEPTQKSDTVHVQGVLPQKASMKDIETALRVRQQTPLGNLHVTYVHRDGAPMEVFASLSRAGEMPAADLEAICRMVSLYLRSGGSMDEVISQLHGIGSNTSRPTSNGSISSIPDGLSVALRTAQNHIQGKENNGKKYDPTIQDIYKIKCPDCGSEVSMSEGCQTCKGCGYSKC